MPEKNSFRVHLERVAAGSSADVIKYPSDRGVRRNERQHLTLLSYQNTDHAPTSIRVRVEHGDDTFYIHDEASVSANRVYAYDDEIVLTPDEQLSIYFNGATSGDILHVWIQGYTVYSG